ncbi:Mediator of RNA polymerase II transcription subunit 14 [Teratosphaeria destructans]|uniref:Mediator of RNA polymerase II transcription subunit 14 n=1 Tax=Teratosphaeria destructans TaxID=418781 RepID=A0A9W7T2A9_9PEZI|nr:Mediator of RNA polymerase II transcription subunit 14 [Teratosphaeria destructans]
MTKQAVAAAKDHRKPCTLCQTPRDVLVRCQIDETSKWHMVCPGSCWKQVSGGVVDGDKAEEHRSYKYGGMWKNKHEAVSAKMPKSVSKKSQETKAQLEIGDGQEGDSNAE